jgi:hypothetical protein
MGVTPSLPSRNTQTADSLAEKVRGFLLTDTLLPRDNEALVCFNELVRRAAALEAAEQNEQRIREISLMKIATERVRADAAEEKAHGLYLAFHSTQKERDEAIAERKEIVADAQSVCDKLEAAEGRVKKLEKERDQFKADAIRWHDEYVAAATTGGAAEVRVAQLEAALRVARDILASEGYFDDPDWAGTRVIVDALAGDTETP